MHPHNSKKAHQGFTLIELLIVVVILGIIAGIVIPRLTDVSRDASHTSLHNQLQTLRGQIELYNVKNPMTVYDAGTAVATFWDPLVQGNYIVMPPKNPLQNNSSTVAIAAAPGVGWLWAEAVPGDPWTLSVYAVDELNGWFDGDGDGSPD